MNRKIKLTVKNLSVSFDMYDSAVSRAELYAINDISLEAYDGEIVAIVGSSGSGKSLLANAVMGILPDNAKVNGEIFYENTLLDDSSIRAIRGKKIALIPQSVAYLDPLMKVGKQSLGTLTLQEKNRAIFEEFSLDESVKELYPVQLSGGMARRILISTALMTEADIIIADEATVGIENALALKTMERFRKLAAEGKTVILITHDIDLALGVADRIAVFYSGTIVEIAANSDFKNGGKELRHPYTKALFRALPQNDFEVTNDGVQPYGAVKKGCVFASRCDIKTSRCEKETIPMIELRSGKVRCINAS